MTISPASVMVMRDCFKVRLYHTNLFIVSVYDGSSLHDQIYCPCWKYSWVIVLWCESLRKLTLRCPERYTVTVCVGLTNMVADWVHSFSHCCFCNAFSLLHTMSLQVIETVPCGCACAFFLCNCVSLRDALNPMKLS